jgi:hypothetical protein
MSEFLERTRAPAFPLARTVCVAFRTWPTGALIGTAGPFATTSMTVAAINLSNAFITEVLLFAFKNGRLHENDINDLVTSPVGTRAIGLSW